MTETTTPAVTFMLQYAEPYDFISYTNRENAVDIENEIDEGRRQFEDMTDSRLSEILENVPEESLNFRDYIDYMNRTYATKGQDKNGQTAVFDRNYDHVPMSEVEGYKQQLDAAYANKSLLWQAVVSFDNQFLAEQGLYDKERQKVDQRALKKIVREAMPSLLEREGISQSAFWWGNVHLNTDNIHVHIGISEIESQREKIFYAKRNRMERKGSFKQKTLKAFKSNIYNGLLDKETKSLILRQEQVLANLRTSLMDGIQVEGQAVSVKERFYLEQVLSHLPTDGRLRFGSNAKDFSIAKLYLNRYLDSYLENEGSEFFHSFKEETAAFLQNYETAYTAKEEGREYEKIRYVDTKALRSAGQTKGFDLDKLMEKRIQDLRERLGNRVLDYIKKQAEGVEANVDLSNSSQQVIKKRDFKQLLQLSSADLTELVNTMVKLGSPLPKDKQELGIYRYALRQKVLIERQIELETQRNRLVAISPSDTDKPFIDLKLDENSALRELTELQKQSSRKLSPEQFQRKQELMNNFIDPVQVPISRVTSIVLENNVNRLMQEVGAAQGVKDESIITLLYGADMTKEKYIKQLQNQIEVLEIKGAIHKENTIIGNTVDEEVIQQLRKENGKRFGRLKELYGELNGKPTREKKNELARLEWDFQRDNQTSQAISRQLQVQSQNRQSRPAPQVSKTFMSGLSQALLAGKSSTMKAFMKKVRADEKEEREEETRSRSR